MRILTLSKLLVAGGAIAWAAKRFARRAKPNEARSADEFAADPTDPVQTFEEESDLHVADLEVDAVDAADAEAAQDLASLETELDESALEIDTPSETTLDAQDLAVEDTGELYGVHTPRAVDNTIPDDRAAFDEGQNWIEALETSAAEYGANPEQELDLVDEQDVPPHPSDTRDTPVADRGSGGPGGV